MSETPRERLAAYAHEAWSGWMRYLFEKCNEVGDGCYEIPSWAVKRWERQASTPYANLPEDEKDSDRAEADKILAISNRSGPLRAVEIVQGFPTDSIGIVEVIDQEHLLAALRAELGDE